jgi:uncharacterized protein YjbI with pentapeptide repeats
MAGNERDPAQRAEELLGRYKAGERHFEEEDLSGANLQRADLNGADLQRADFSGANLRSAILRATVLGGANLRGADLSGADLSGANLRGATLSGANFERANFERADLEGANLQRANLGGAELSGANLRGAYLLSAELSGANLRGAILESADLRGAILEGANFERADLSGADLEDANLSGADLSLTSLSGADLEGADLQRADLGGADLCSANLRRANFGRANLSGAMLCGADLSGADLSDANLRRADLSGAILDGAILGGASLGWNLLVDINLAPFSEAEPPGLHDGPSTVDFKSIVRSLRSPTLEPFLLRTGLPEVFVEHMIDCALALDSLAVFRMLQSTFLSYGSSDEPFAKKLHEALRRSGVTTFFFPEHAIPSKKLHRTRRDGVDDYDRVILICSKVSLTRSGVLNEIEKALARESAQNGERILIPIQLDDYLLNGWAPPDPATANALRARVVADFEGADTDPEKFSEGVLRLVAALKK